jgi:hypothetical protein
MSDIETRVRDAITMNVDFMDGPPSIVERALASAGHVRRRQRRRRALASGLLVAVGVAAIVGVAAARHDDRGLTIAAESPTTTHAATTSSVPAAPLWNVPVTRAQVLVRGRDAAIDPNTAIVTAKLASFAELQDAGAAMGTGPDDTPGRRIWVISISGPVHPGHCCLAPHAPFRWGVVFVDATSGDGYMFSAGPTGNVAPWFARLPDHGA